MKNGRLSPLSRGSLPGFVCLWRGGEVQLSPQCGSGERWLHLEEVGLGPGEIAQWVEMLAAYV